MITILFLMSLVVSTLLVDKYNALQDQFFLAVEKLDRDQLLEFGLDNSNSFKLHLNRLKYFQSKPFLKIGDPKVNLMGRKLTLLNRLSAMSILSCATFAAFKFL